MPKNKFAFSFDITSILIIFMQIRAFPRSVGSSLNRGSIVVVVVVVVVEVVVVVV